ncbi:MAG: hypothetical protein HFI31_00445 [Lachnospiraceae bacterium]|nr:hypothetical protein [Lachnospiraceae bacterium]
MKGIYNLKSKGLKVNNSPQKFNEDAINYENDFWSIVSQGFFLNEIELKEKYHVSDTFELLLCLINETDGEISRLLYGSYVIVAFDKIRQRLIICNDLLSKHSLYYAIIRDTGMNEEVLIFSDSYFETIDQANKLGAKLTIDLLGIKMMNRHRIFYDDITYLKEVKFLKPYKWIDVIDNDVIVKGINIPKEDDRIEAENIITKCNQLFEKAVKEQYHKNVNYGYKQVVTLSGGMDSRTTFLYGLKAGYKNQICYTYAEADSMDFQIAQSIADNEGCQFFFHSITNGNFLMKRNEIAEENEGQMVYGGATGTYESICMYDTSQWGIVHTGIGGGEIMGDLCVADEQKGWKRFEDSLDCTEQERERLKFMRSEYDGYNQFSNLNDIRRCLNSQKTAQRFCEYMSPFLYEPFFNWMLTIPYEIKKERKLYLKWLEKYCKTNYPSTFKFGAKKDSKMNYYLRRCINYISNKSGRKTIYDMNPYQYWEKTNIELVNKLTELYETDLNELMGKIDNDIVKVIQEDWDIANINKKINILTTTWALCKFVNLDKS